jgi:NADH-quinone oxidoreductase E subunit
VVISEATRSKIGAEMEKYPQKRGALLTALHLVQKDLGFVSGDAAQELAGVLEIRPIDVLEVVSFYNMFYSEPQARHHVNVCTNLPCSLRGARTLMRQVEAYLGTRAGGVTSDGRVALGHEECLGACAYAPMMRVDETYHEDLDLEKVKTILDGLD